MKQRSAALGTVLALFLAACQPATTGGTVKVGFIGPLTGDAAALGIDILNGTLLAVEEFNAAGGLNGKQVEIIAEDGKCTSADATSAAQKLVNIDKVAAILGGQCSGETLAAAAVADPAKIVMISAGSSSPDVTDAGEYVFRIYPSDSFKTVAIAKVLAQKGLKRIALITENNDYALAIKDGLKKDVQGATYVMDEVVDASSKDFRSLFTRLKDQEFDVFIPNPGQNAVMAALITQFREAGFTQPIVTQDVGDAADVLQAVGDQENNVFTFNIPGITDSAFGETFTAKYGEPKAGILWSALGYDAAKVLLERMKTADSGEALQRTLLTMPEYDGLIGTFQFDENGDVVGIPLALKQYQSGAIIEVENIPLN